MSTPYNIFKLEKNIYFVIWIGAVMYSIYSFATSSCKYFQYYKDEYEDLANGFSFFSRRRDKADFEWEAIYFLIYNFFLWIFLYLFISEIIRSTSTSSKVLQLWQICFTIIFLQLQVGCMFLCIILFQPAIYYFKNIISKNVVSTWICTAGSLILLTYFKKYSTDFLKFSSLNEQEFYFVTLSLFWLNLKCSSYSFEKQNDTGVLDFLSYCLYPPTMFSGPFISYTDFRSTYKSQEFLPIQGRLKKLVANIARVLFWFLFGNFCLHYVYVNATSFHPKLVETFSNWSLYGYGYAMGQFFHIKYVVLYGLSTSCAAYENINVPRLPRCIGRVHLYSDMWKYFDPGLYKFLVKLIYVPAMKFTSSKLVSSFLCFLFIYIWHGIENYILIWTILNYLGITLEDKCSSLSNKYFKDDMKSLDPYWLRRLKCLLAAPLLAMSAISNFYFFAGTAIGNIFFYRIFTNNLFDNLLLLLILYCCCQVSVELRRVNANKM